MNCPNCGHAMNHHAAKLPLDACDAHGDNRSQVIEAYSCPHCGTNAARLAEG